MNIEKIPNAPVPVEFGIFFCGNPYHFTVPQGVYEWDFAPFAADFFLDSKAASGRML